MSLTLIIIINVALDVALLASIVREAFGVTVVGLAVGISGDRGWGVSARAGTGWG